MEEFEPGTIRASRSRLVGFLLVVFVVIGAIWGGLYALGDWLQVPLAIPRLAIRWVLLGLGLVVATVVWLVIAARLAYDLAFPRRLELGRETVRLIRPGPSGEAVEADIPYRNIAKVTPARGRKATRLAVALHDVADPDTRITSVEGRHRVAVGVSYRLPSGWELADGEVAERLRRRCRHLLPP
jgi:hypothetical protein